VIELKPVALDDSGIIFHAWGRHPENFAYLTAPTFTGLDDAKRYIAKLFQTPDSKAFHIIDPTVGVVGLVKAGIFEHRAQIGYVIHRPFWGRGFATEATRQMTAVVEALPNVLRVWATCALDNPASARVLEKCGYEREGILRNWVTYPAQGNRAFDNYSYVKPSPTGLP
jgi:ribosomal-protein-alanine N-acetyltransferase